MNKRGLFFASISIIMVVLLVIGYDIFRDKQANETGIGDVGKASFSIIKTNIESEKLNYYIESSVNVAKSLGLRNVKENIGVYDFSSCEINEGYVVLIEGCDYLGPDLAFEKSFNATFDSMLKKYDPSFSSDDFELQFNGGVLSVTGTKKLNLGIRSKSDGKDLDKSLNHDGILESVRKYSQLYGVSEDLIKAVILQESSGRVDAFSGSSYGVMQINKGAHPQWFDDEGCNAGVDVDCNINAGVEILSGYIDTSQTVYEARIRNVCSNPFTQSKFLGYKGEKAGLRLYNGPGCGCETCDDDYVEKVLARLDGGVLQNVGTLVLDINVENIVDYDFNILPNLVLVGGDIRACVKADVDIDSCINDQFNPEYSFNVVEEGNLLKFDVQETKFDDESNTVGDVIKFALEIENSEEIVA
ncbi:MAG: hypothetical protein CMH62_02250 [Nanoarchaeota archaeon]|nr:hypothetical protein [Nanoarchaeota archaeon]|tara:strand:- start:1920 stop:3164 length:1245 start_codon:yes stop_codon:yes gene_type:complete